LVYFSDHCCSFNSYSHVLANKQSQKLSKYAERKSQLEEIYDLIERYQFPMLETVVRNRVSVNSANKARKPLARHRRFDAATKDYEDLTKEVLALME
jgi:cellulose biosynthesis protein BcsQ